MIPIDVIHMAYSCSFFSYIAILILSFLVVYGFFFFFLVTVIILLHLRNVSWKFYLEKLSCF